MRYFFPLFIILSCLLTFLPGCEPKEDLVQTSGSLEIGADTVLFDTVFATVKTVTKRLWVYNRNSGAVKTDVSLSGTAGTTYSLIINGDAGPAVKDITVRGKDSLLVLVRAVLGPGTTDKPFLITDEVHFRTNGDDQNAKLVAYGQNAYFHRADIITGNRTEVWRSDKPHVIINSPYAQPTGPPVNLGVYVDSGSTLQIEPGARIYCHAGATIQVNGRLKINAALALAPGDTTAAKRAVVYFQGDRREAYYAEVPGQWGGIFFTSSSSGNVIRYTDIRNANFGVSVLNTQNRTPLPDLQLGNVTMRNISGSNPNYVGTGLPPGGIIGVLANISAQNCLLTNCGEYAVLGFGGAFTFNFCTFANYTPTFQRKTSALTFSNALEDAGGKVRFFQPTINVTNSIVWGSIEDELYLENNGDYLTTINIRNSVVRTKEYQATTNATDKPGLAAAGLSNLVNVDPLFKRTSLTSSRPDYRLQDSSPARDRTSFSGTPPPADLLNALRNTSRPTLGAYH